MTRATVGVMVRIDFVVVLLNFFIILHILHCAHAEWEVR